MALEAGQKALEAAQQWLLKPDREEHLKL